MSKEKHSSWPAVIVFSLIVMFGIGYFAIPPYLEINKELNFNYAVLNKEISKTQQKIDDLNYLKGQFANNKTEVDQLNLALAKNNLADIITSLNKMSQESGVTMSDLKPTTKDSSPKILTVNIKGFYDGLKAFLAKLQNNIQPLSVSDIVLTQASSEITKGLLGANLTVNIFQADQSASSTNSNNTSASKQTGE
ncbi:MAG: type 4a pilus biogenesis protein PilO [Patescibacteria group bacterium]|nr:type 4a pilus biogenesis protein PilO [Patescibacteria group bacterium]